MGAPNPKKVHSLKNRTLLDSPFYPKHNDTFGFFLAFSGAEISPFEENANVHLLSSSSSRTRSRSRSRSFHQQ